MQYFDFHHHKKNTFGIYNLNFGDHIPEEDFSIGIHPKDIDENYENQLNWLKETSKHPRCNAIGECGLDGIITTDFQLQKEVFLDQIIWANTIRKPIIVHCVKRFSELIPFKKIAKVPMIIHGYNKKSIIAEQLNREGFYLSFGKSLLDNLSLQAIFRNFPLDRFFLETDDDYFDIETLYQLASQLKSCSIKELQSQINYNLKQIYNP